MSVDAILEAIQSLTAAERAELLGRLDEVMPSDLGEMSPELAKMLEERVADADADANPGAAIPWEEVYRESLKRVGQ